MLLDIQKKYVISILIARKDGKRQVACEANQPSRLKKYVLLKRRFSIRVTDVSSQKTVPFIVTLAGTPMN
jgi:hypothetical protein